MPDDKVCFVISPIGEGGSEIRRRADQVLKYVIEPACAKCGFTAVRADKISVPGNITSQVIQHVMEDPMVIADLTGSNGNVFYELALRHAIKKPFVQIIEDGETIPFDVQGMRTVYLNHHDLDSVHNAVDELEQHIKSVDGKLPEQIDSPITIAIDFQSLRQSGDPKERSIAEFASILSEIRTELRHVKHILGPRGEFNASLVGTTIWDNLSREALESLLLRNSAYRPTHVATRFVYVPQGYGPRHPGYEKVTCAQQKTPSNARG